VRTFDDHEDKVWGLAVRKDQEQLVTGGADSTICVWEDYSEREQEEEITKQEEKILKQQELANHVQNKDYHKALLLAFTIGHTEKILGILTDVVDLEGMQAMQDLVKKLTKEEIGKCLLYIRDWNTIGKFSTVAQKLLHCVLRLYSPAKLMALSPQVINLKELLQAVIPYTEKHFSRFDRLLQQSYIVDFTISSITNNVVGTMEDSVVQIDDESAEKDNKEDSDLQEIPPKSNKKRSRTTTTQKIEEKRLALR